MSVPTFGDHSPSYITAEVEAEMRDWIFDVFGIHTATLTRGEVIAGIQRHYEGGWRAFIADGVPS